MLVTEFAPAKINLHLHVTGRRPNGYHLLDSLVVFADVGDRLTYQPAETLSLAVTGPFAAKLEGELDNLVLWAARALAETAGVSATGHLVLEKNLPVSSGIGGGSADAAAALRLLVRCWDVPFDKAMGMAASIGADVPVCLASRPAMMAGIGEILSPAPALPRLGLVLINPGVAVSTPSVFKARDGEFSAPAAFPAQGWDSAEALVTALKETRNDLQVPAQDLAPEITRVLGALGALPGCLMARMSGSGATCFGIFRDPEAAASAIAGFQRPGWWVWGGGLHRSQTL